MSIRCWIGLWDKFANGYGMAPAGNEVTHVYCHHDGYPEGVGQVLLNSYTERDQIGALMMGGGMSSLGEIPSECNTYWKWRQEICLAEQVYVKAEEADTVAKYLKTQRPHLFKETDIEYYYMFDAYTRTWWVLDVNEDKVSELTDVLGVPKF